MRQYRFSASYSPPYFTFPPPTILHPPPLFNLNQRYKTAPVLKSWDEEPLMSH